MIKPNDNNSYSALLRKKAVDKLLMRKDNGLYDNNKSSEKDLLKLVHELEVHQMELEMQNEELTFSKRKAELAEEKYTELYDFAPSGYLTITKDGLISELNFVAAQMLGKSRSSLQNSLFSFYISVESRPVFNRFFENIFKNKTKETCEVMIAVDDQHPIFVSLSGIFVENEKYCRVSATDITECKLAEDKLKESEIQYRNLADSGSALIWTSGLDKLCNYFNLPWLKFTGRTLEQEIGNGWAEGVHPDDFDRCLETYLLAFDKHEPFEMEYRLLHSSGEYKWILDLGAPNFDRNKVFVGYIGHCFDISDRKQSELLIQRKTEKIAVQNEELIIAKERAEESDRLKSAFLANMSHEIRTPMNGILGFAELLQTPRLTGEQQQEYIRIIQKSGERMLNIINDIVDISKIEAGLVKLNIRESDINMQVEYIYTFFRPEAEAKGLKFSTINLLAADESIIRTDREKLYAILTNLVKNSIKYTENGEIELGCFRKDDHLEFYVRDTGIGIPRDRLNAVFERFIQADIADKMARQGAGLGLAITKAYVDILGGNIWVESEIGFGSTFYFTLPCNNEPINEKSKQQLAPSSKMNNFKKLKILIAEDDEVSEMFISINVAEFAKEILNVRTGVDAVETCRLNPDIDLILMDICMPEMGGYEATRQIREFDKNVIIIAQTAFALNGDKEKAIKAGCDDYITKPINIGGLNALLLKYFGKLCSQE